ncbi:MAG: stage II sporulation protein M [Myxococcota bacterium]
MSKQLAKTFEVRKTFVERRKPSWDQLEVLLSKNRVGNAAHWSDLASLYRDVSADLARAQALGLPDDVLHHLDGLAGRAHNRLYGAKQGAGLSVVYDLLIGFPKAVRRQWAFVLAAHLLFYVPFFVGILGGLLEPSFAGSVLSEGQLVEMEAMYADTIERSAGEDASMAGFYVWNNVGIAFRCFATGALAGLGSAFYLIYNGLILGTVEGFLWSRGLGWNLTDFTVGHTPWELTGIAISGAGGLRLGWALVVTGGRTRMGALRHASGDLYRLVLGAAAMLVVAAAIEGFWSSAPLWLPLKIAFGVAGALVIVLWVWVGIRWGRS